MRHSGENKQIIKKYAGDGCTSAPCTCILLTVWNIESSTCKCPSGARGILQWAPGIEEGRRRSDGGDFVPWSACALSMVFCILITVLSTSFLFTVSLSISFGLTFYSPHLSNSLVPFFVCPVLLSRCLSHVFDRFFNPHLCLTFRGVVALKFYALKNH